MIVQNLEEYDMKKLLALLLAGLMTLSFAACGTNDTPSGNEDNPGVSQSGENNDNQGGEENNADEPYSMAAFERFLAALNLVISDVEPNFKWKIDGEKQVFAEDPTANFHQGIIIMTKEDGEMSEDEYNAWIQKVFDATAKASDDGYNVVGKNFCGDNEQPDDKVDLETAKDQLVQGWGFRIGDTTYSVYFYREVDKDKESGLGYHSYYDGVRLHISNV